MFVDASVAQRSERPVPNPVVAGSIPAGRLPRILRGVPSIRRLKCHAIRRFARPNHLICPTRPNSSTSSSISTNPPSRCSSRPPTLPPRPALTSCPADGFLPLRWPSWPSPTSPYCCPGGTHSLPSAFVPGPSTSRTSPRCRATFSAIILHWRPSRSRAGAAASSRLSGPSVSERVWFDEPE